jgi:hypothetical protein
MTSPRKALVALLVAVLDPARYRVISGAVEKIGNLDRVTLRVTHTDRRPSAVLQGYWEDDLDVALYLPGSAPTEDALESELIALTDILEDMDNVNFTRAERVTIEDYHSWTLSITTLIERRH